MILAALVEQQRSGYERFGQVIRFEGDLINVINLAIAYDVNTLGIGPVFIAGISDGV